MAVYQLVLAHNIFAIQLHELTTWQCSLYHDRKIAIIMMIESISNVKITGIQNHYKTMFTLL